MSDVITEFEFLDPTRVDGVGSPANGVTFLALKSLDTKPLDETGDLTKARWAGFCGEEACEVCKERFGVAFPELLAKAKLKTKARNKLPSSAFALPETREYPIHDASHARAALSMLHNASPEEQSKIKAAVHRRYPEIDSDEKAEKMESQEQEQSGATTPAPSSVEGQTHEVHSGREMGAVHMTVTQEGVMVHNPSFEGAPAPKPDQEGYGTPASDKTLPMAESQSQTHANARKAAIKKVRKNMMQLAAAAQALSSMGGEGDGRGDPAPEGGADLDEAKREGITQTNEVTRKDANTPGSEAWETHDADLAAGAAQLAEHAQQLMEELESREKEETHSPSTETSTSKEIDMTPDELLKMLDERDARRDSEAKKVAKEAAAKAKKKMKAKMKEDAEMPEMAEKALNDPLWAAANPKLAAKAARWAAKAGVERMTKAAAVQTTIGDLAKQVAEVKDLAEKIAAQPMPLPYLNAAGLDARGGAAVNRGMAPSLIKERKATEQWSPNSVRAELAAKGALSDVVPGSAAYILQKFAAAGSPEGKFSI